MKRAYYQCTAAELERAEAIAEIAPTKTPDLHLSVSLRSFRAEKLSDFIGAIIEGEGGRARTLLSQLVIFVPEGDPIDPSRNPAYYDGIFAFLRSCGIPTIDEEETDIPLLIGEALH